MGAQLLGPPALAAASRTKLEGESVSDGHFAVKIGDYVRCYIPDHGTAAENRFVLGWMLYDTLVTKRTMALVGDEKAHGMPINISHLTVISRGHEVAAWRDRYINLYPTAKVVP